MKFEEGDLFAVRQEETPAPCAASPGETQLPTYDQLANRLGGLPENGDLTPNARIDAELVMEPVAGGVYVTVRDTEHKPLIGFIAGRSGASAMVAQTAVMAPMREMIKIRLEGPDSKPPEAGREAVLAALEAFKTETLAAAAKSIDTQAKAESQATRLRAAAIIDALADARRILSDAMKR